ncbi:MAG: hypothetical protein MZV49_02510 [Rhodopseudomonas palustris]|nr:hypothetical protein [Rhodopseudomonas palustris]
MIKAELLPINPDRTDHGTGGRAQSQLRLARLPQGAGRFRAHHHPAARRRL